MKQFVTKVAIFQTASCFSKSKSQLFNLQTLYTLSLGLHQWNTELRLWPLYSKQAINN